MWKRALFNFLCNLGIFFCLLCAYYGFGSKQYIIIAACAFGTVVLVMIKIRLIKEVRNLGKKP